MSGILDQILRQMQGGAAPSRNLPSDLGPLLDQLRQAGLGRQVDSWIGTGPNEPVEPAELERALGQRGPGAGGGLGGTLGGLTGGLGGGMLGGLLAQALPYIINAMTPRGRVADEDVPEGGLGRILEGLRGGNAGGAASEGGLGQILGGLRAGGAPPAAGTPPDAGGLSGMLGRTLGRRD